MVSVDVTLPWKRFSWIFIGGKTSAHVRTYFAQTFAQAARYLYYSYCSCLCTADWLRLKMPSSNPLSFLRPLYDIAVWKFILMRQYGGKDPFTWRMHALVASFLCKLLEMSTFSHLQEKLLDDETKQSLGNWKLGDKPTDRLIGWCQDQWRRKKFNLKEEMKSGVYSSEPATISWSEDIPLCFNCCTPCPSCREELKNDIPREFMTANAILAMEEANKSADDSDTGHHAAERMTPIAKRLRKSRKAKKGKAKKRS